MRGVRGGKRGGKALLGICFTLESTWSIIVEILMANIFMRRT